MDDNLNHLEHIGWVSKKISSPFGSSIIKDVLSFVIHINTYFSLKHSHFLLFYSCQFLQVVLYNYYQLNVFIFNQMFVWYFVSKYSLMLDYK